MTVAGIATGLTSGVAGYTHTKVKRKIVEKQYNDANTCLIKHYESCKEMIRLLEPLELDMKTIMKFRRDHMESNLKELLTDVEGVDITDHWKITYSTFERPCRYRNRNHSGILDLERS